VPEFMGICPSCQHTLVIRELECPHCGLELRARFALPEYAALTPELAQFLKLFVVARGNLRELERTLGVSYPTVRAKLDQLVAVFDPSAPPPNPELDRQQILDRIARRELTVDEGLRLLDALKGGE
jgi:hypothetical protein